MEEEGFTLIEVLIAITITGIILVAIFMMLDLGFSTWQRHAKNEDWKQEWRILEQFLADDINNLFVSHLYDSNKFRGDYKQLSFITLRNEKLLEVTYSFNYNKNELIRKVRNVADNKLLEQMIFFSEVKIYDINFFFYHRENDYWLDNWLYSDDKTLPESIKLTIDAKEISIPNLTNNIYLNFQY